MELKKFARIFIFVFSIILVFINSFYYYQTRQTLTQNQLEKGELIINNINNAVSARYETERYFNDFLSKRLRDYSLAIQDSLPPNIEDVERETLFSLKDKFALGDITLLAQKGDDIVAVEATNDTDIGLSAKEFDNGKSFVIMKRLLTSHEAGDVGDFGEKFQNFWSGPIDTSVLNPDLITKWGYYNDGTTDYIINASIQASAVEKFYKTAGVDNAINHVMDNDENILAIAVLNTESMSNNEFMNHVNVEPRFSQRLVIAGSRYPYTLHEEHEFAEQAMAKEVPVNKVLELRKEKVLKTYYPANFKGGDDLTDHILIEVTYDYDAVTDELAKRFFKIVLISVILILIGMLFLAVTIQFSLRKEEALVSVQEMYKNHVDTLFENIREYRHDFNHHLYTLSGLSNMGLTDDLNDYIANLVSEHSDLNDIIDVNIPALSGLLQYKKTKAANNGIVFEHHFESTQELNLNLEKSTYLVKVTGNIMSNAFHAVEESDVEPKRIVVYGKYKDNKLTIKVSNNGAMIPLDLQEKIFKQGFTTRVEAGGTGIGLASSKKGMERYGGTIKVQSTEKLTTFTVEMPIHKDELISR